MIAWLRRARQTHTPVHDEASRQRERQSGLALARNALCAVLLVFQLLFWVIVWGYEQSHQTAWQAAALMAVPIAALWLIWRRCPGAESAGGALIALPLLLCLMIDYYMMLFASNDLMNRMIPSFQIWGRVTIIAAFPLVTVWLCGEKGLSYGAYAMRVILLVLFALSTVLVLADVRPQRLWPLLGKGAAHTALTTLSGVGSAWGLALFYLFPADGRGCGAEGACRPGKAPAYIWLALGLCVLWALWMGLCSPWQPGDRLSVGEKLLALSQYSSSILIAETGALFWMLLLPIGLAGALAFGSRLMNAAFPRLPRMAGALAAALPGTLAVALSPSALFSFLPALLPWRYALSALIGVLLLLCRRKEDRR